MTWNRQASFLIFACLISIDLDFSEFIMDDIDVARCRWMWWQNVTLDITRTGLRVLFQLSWWDPMEQIMIVLK